MTRSGDEFVRSAYDVRRVSEATMPRPTRLPLTLAVAVVLILAACRPAPTANAPTLASPTPTGKAASPLPSPSSTPSPANSAFGPCQLPVELTGSPPQSGWLALPGDQFSPDPSAAAAISRDGDLAWDSGIGKWLPTEPTMISPDGASYVAEGTADIEIADSRTGKVIRSFPPGPATSPTSGYVVAAWTPAGIYVVSGGKNPVYGLWNVDPTTGVVTQVAGSAIRAPWSLVDRSAAWASIINTDNSTSVLRLDLSSGHVRTLYTTPSPDWAPLLGFVGSGVLALDNDTRDLTSAHIIGADGTVTEVSLPTQLVGVLASLNPGVIQDGSTIFFSGKWVGVAAYAPLHGVQVLVPSGQDFSLLGRCKSS